MTKPKLELTWIGKETRPRLESRILIEDPEKCYCEKSKAKGVAAKIGENYTTLSSCFSGVLHG